MSEQEMTTLAPAPEPKPRFRLPTIEWAGICRAAVAVLLLVLTAFVLISYIAGPSLGVIHSDCTDSLLWSQVMLETGEILSPDFNYAALLPFGSSLWTVPILAICGYTTQAYVLSMATFAVLFVLAAFSLFRAMKWDLPGSAVGTFCLAMLLSGSAKLREIMWEHTIYYSLSILLVMVLLNLCLRLITSLEGERKSGVGIWIWGVLLVLVTVGCATDGFQLLAVSVVPVGGALIAQALFDKRRLLCRRSLNRYALCALMVMGTLIGLLILRMLTRNGEIIAGYENAYSGWSMPDKWMDNLWAFMDHYLALFGVEIGGQFSLFSYSSVLLAAKLLAALAILVCPLILVFRYRKLHSRASQLVLWVHLTVSAVIMFGFVCGTLSSANWRLTPMLGTAILATLTALWELLAAKGVLRRVGVLLLVLLTAVSALAAFRFLCRPPAQTLETRPETAVIDLLKEKGYSEGYATFWNAQIITLLSDGEVEMLSVTTDNGAVNPYTYQNLKTRFDERIVANESCFLLLTEAEYNSLTEGGYFTSIGGREILLEELTCGNYRILVYENNIFI